MLYDGYIDSEHFVTGFLDSTIMWLKENDYVVDLRRVIVLVTSPLLVLLEMHLAGFVLLLVLDKGDCASNLSPFVLLLVISCIYYLR